MQETYNIREEFTYLEFLEILYIQLIRMKMIRRIGILVTAIGLLGGLMTFVSPKVKEMPWYGFVIPFAGPPIVFCLLIIILGAVIAFILMKMRPGLFSGTILTFSHWGIEKKGEAVNYSAQWSKILKLSETKKYFFLYTSEQEAHVVQKRMFENDAQIKGFKEFLSEKIQAK